MLLKGCVDLSLKVPGKYWSQCYNTCTYIMIFNDKILLLGLCKVLATTVHISGVQSSDSFNVMILGTVHITSNQ